MRVVNCDRCRNKRLGTDIEDGKLKLSVICKEKKRDFSDVTHDNYKEEVSKQLDCDGFNSKFIEYPIEVSEIVLPEGRAIKDSWSASCGQLVKVRPVNEKYEGKTYLGIFLGDADIGLSVSHNPENKQLSVHRMHNPAIFVPELKEIIYGTSSWWGAIESEEELREISDDDIANVWYVKMLQDVAVEED